MFTPVEAIFWLATYGHKLESCSNSRRLKTLRSEIENCELRGRDNVQEQMEGVAFIILQIFFAKRVFLKVEEYPPIFPSFSRVIFGHVTCLDQSRARENI